MTEFLAFPKIPRLFRDVTITEKIDGTNGCIIIDADLDYTEIKVQSRKQIITQEKDNFGFAAWVYDNAETLVEDLGPGYHYGEWWGKGIQRGYGLDHRRFSLFNTYRWADAEFKTPNLHVVPVLYEGLFSTDAVNAHVWRLAMLGSQAAPGFSRAEGVIVHHDASRQMFKVTVENDAMPKAVAKRVAA